MLGVVERIGHETGLALQIRIGMAAGAVMAGVIGTRKFTYDIWGDAVNLAARLESSSLPGRILVCPVCHARLAHTMELEPLGRIDIKGVGTQEVWFIARPQDAFGSAAAQHRHAERAASLVGRGPGPDQGPPVDSSGSGA
jgi:adenylate cyclase